jgi:hypothetical protein
MVRTVRILSKTPVYEVSILTCITRPPPLTAFFSPKVALTTENEACILREVTDGLLRREI